MSLFSDVSRTVLESQVSCLMGVKLTAQLHVLPESHVR
jgi:hypothetical protein